MSNLADAVGFLRFLEMHTCFYENIFYAGMAELADVLDLGSNAARRAGSNPVTRTSKSP